MTEYVEHLPDEYTCGKVDVRNDGIQRNLKLIHCKTENCTNLQQIFTVSGRGLDQEEMVKSLK